MSSAGSAGPLHQCHQQLSPGMSIRTNGSLQQLAGVDGIGEA